MAWPGPSSFASRIAPATLMPVEPPRHRPSCSMQIEDDRHRLLVGNQIGLVDLDVFDDRGDAPKPDAFA